MRQEGLQTDDLKVVARGQRHGGYAAWRTPPPGRKGTTVFGLCHRGRWTATLDELTTGISDAELAALLGHPRSTMGREHRWLIHTISAQ